MLPVFAFIAFWIALGLVVFFAAIRGGPGAAHEGYRRPSPGTRRLIGLLFAVIYVGFGVAIPLVFLVGNHNNANAQVGGIKLTPTEKQGRELFGAHCGVCHTLAAANAVGKVGPNLDELRPPLSLVLHTIQNGCLQNPQKSNSPQSCLGQGTMPADIVQGKDAVAVSRFVAKVAGRE